MTLMELGWTEAWDASFEGAWRAAGYVPARVARQERDSCLVCGEAGEWLAAVSGRFRHDARGPGALPAVGDWVAAAPRPAEGRATIHALLPRRSCFARTCAGQRSDQQILAANVDVAFLVSGLDRDFNLRRIERYLTLAYDSGATPVVVLNKADLCDDVDAFVAQVDSVAYGTAVCPVSAVADGGAEPLRQWLGAGRTAVLLGSSGVGKSTLINALVGAARQRTGAVRAADGRGRHTTTQRELIALDAGGVLIDTPGLRELQLWADPDAADDAFSDIAELAARCRFRDCAHSGEPGCAVQAALARGELDVRRYENYLQLQAELRHAARRQDHQLRQAERARWKRIAMDVRRLYRERDR
ncbi:MAG: ribosome small subunit-dependent GTPase A [Planctomycetes bacterium]|nr:ribosome small subunit-dependent GTPase A [Planctomycetota bacterium]